MKLAPSTTTRRAFCAAAMMAAVGQGAEVVDRRAAPVDVGAESHRGGAGGEQDRAMLAGTAIVEPNPPVGRLQDRRQLTGEALDLLVAVESGRPEQEPLLGGVAGEVVLEQLGRS
jgi:hypothetical protein